jgi:A/G-specific adenine glycosylase
MTDDRVSDKPMEGDPQAETLARLLLEHFDSTRRDMPWRRTTDPYAIWVSEVMLQQTRVEAVIPYYNRWLTQFPDITALAGAEEPAVLRAWEGLGYYSRARNLHKAARIVRETMHGTIPGTREQLMALPGVGAYTAGAVSSIAFGRREPAVDGNARRVFARVLDMEDSAIPAVAARVRDIIPADRPGDFNQAVMELGATICTPRPHCGRCPVAGCCVALQRGTVALRPTPTQRRPVPTFDLAVAIVLAPDNRVHVTQRPGTGLLAGFWEFPARAAAHSTMSRTAGAIVRALLHHAPRPRRLETVSHTFSHRVEIYHPFVYRLKTDPVCDVTSAWADRDRLMELPMAVAQRRIAQLAGL